MFSLMTLDVFAESLSGHIIDKDSTETQSLDEIVVEADRMYMFVNKVSYTPTRQQRNASSNGVMLLQQLAIPQLQVNPLAGTVSTNTGEAVSFFIDGVPATDNDVSDINTRDVLRVEVLDYPADPKFRNSAHVVNYVMQKYEYGGYTKLNTTEMLVSCFSSYNTLNSKMVYKKMTFDARACHQYTNGCHSGTEETLQFRLPGYEKEAPNGITRSNLWKDSEYISNRQSTSFRALYQNNNTQFSSTLNWSFIGTRSDWMNGTLHYTPDLFDSDTWSANYPSRRNTVGWSNEFFQQLPNQWALSASVNLTYDHVNQTQVRTEGDIDLLDLTAKEDIWATAVEIDFSKQFNGKHAVSLNATSVTYKSDIGYYGSVRNTNNVLQLILAPGASYTFMPNNKLYARLGLYATYYYGKTAAVVEKKVYPTVNFYLNWMPHKSHRFGAMFDYAITTPNGTQTNSVILQTDLLKWSQGNPDLKSYHTTVSQLTYTWNPSQHVNISPVVTWVYKHNYFADTYSLTNNGRGLLVRPENCGNYHNIWGSVNFSAYALNRKFIIQAAPSVSHHIFNGMFAKSYTSLYATLSATYYWGQFYAGASYSTPKKYFNQADPIQRNLRCQYWLMTGWGNASWTVSAFLINPFRNHWRSDEMSIDTPNYSMHSTTISVNEHRRINLSVTYSFGYGKKVQRGNDLEGIPDSKSSIR